MKKQKRLKTVNILGIIVGAIFFLLAISNHQAKDLFEELILGGFGIVLIFLSLTGKGTKPLTAPFVSQSPPPSPLVIKMKIDFINLLIGITLIYLFVPIDRFIENLDRNNIENPSILLPIIGIVFIYIGIRNSVYALYKKDIFRTNPLWIILLLGVLGILFFEGLILFAPNLSQSLFYRR